MHRFSDEEMTERASLYALGALSQWEARAFEEHLSEGCELCATELQSFEETTRSLALAAPEAEPPARAREKLLSLVAGEMHSDSTALCDAALPSLVTLRADEGEWHTAGTGVLVKQLFTDPQTRMVTTLVKMKPGTRIPLHRHSGIEQCYVLEGDFHADNQKLGAGDFHIAHAGSIHEPVYTLEGALVLIIAPQGYEVLEQH
ncbi:MAG TPA: cupin domain-containing protein [Pyrinomonadaceae bacterium]|jgi:putative transcriptional regulator|nr:cupin domain-containing protein [Pyrinomonadaceae bacterium]